MSLSWQTGAEIAGLLLVAGYVAALLPLGRHRLLIATALRQTAVIFGLYALWQVLLDYAVTSTAGAVGHARWVWHAERVVHLPSERSVQRLILPHPVLVHAVEHYYVLSHYGALCLSLAWLFFWHRESYRWCRRMLIVATALTVPVQAIPVAPPRLLSGVGIIDIGQLVGHVSRAPGLGDPGQLTAMPSVHVVWALLVAVFVIRAGHTRWRWLAVAYPAATVFAVVASGNHFWADGILSAAFVALALALEPAVSRAAGLLRRLGPRPGQPRVRLRSPVPTLHPPVVAADDVSDPADRAAQSPAYTARHAR